MHNERCKSGSARGGEKRAAVRRHPRSPPTLHITVFRDDLHEAASVEELEALSNKKRRARLDAIRDACRAYITDPLREFLADQLADATDGAGRIEIDEADPDGQTLLVWYPEVEPRDGAYVRPAVRIESGAKSALDPNRAVTIRPYIAEDIAALDLAVADVTTVEATRTRWLSRMTCAAGTSGVASLGRKGSACRGTITTYIAFSIRRSVK
ncbi:nucleotidyl transferase AbiEii/AbiGii toxin family protein [Phyllobacterium salinisoli]|uniref:nucleotidyl transferase AbiEii/AbiGii toxin family protein n=1 Tax=Phyllobacterium salinisoli TaxID=1899321 RepID=UPI001FE23E51|nr:nucleotidyl transferase AbiEii/AbiGii toxin family protein [Phyllobacterium salinisoli]